MKGNYNIFYTPEKQYPGMPHGEMCGDFMPFYWKGTFYLFYLYKYCVYVVETKDFVRYGMPKLVLQNGSPDDQDWHIGTGSVFHHDGLFYFHYTGFCEGNHNVEGKNEQVVMRAVSTDLNTWVKDKEFFFKPDIEHYGNLHWRDPHVIWNEELQKYCMIITATEKEGAFLRNGCTAVYVSDDVKNWKHYKKLYAPRTFITHECHDAFQIGKWWYLSFSNYSRWWETRYRISESFNGPWTMPDFDDMFDGREFYAAKTVSDGTRTYLVGWQSVRKDCKDEEKFVWGGNVLVHELVQRPDGTLGVGMVKEIEESFQEKVPMSMIERQGAWSGTDMIQGESKDGFGWAEIGRLSDTSLFETTIEWEEGTKAVGLMIHTSDEKLEKWCQLRLEITHNKIVMDRYNRIDGEQYYMDERPVIFQGNKATVKLIVSGSIMLAYVGDVALSTRCYSVDPGSVGIFVEYGKVNCIDTKLLGQK